MRTQTTTNMLLALVFGLLLWLVGDAVDSELFLLPIVEVSSATKTPIRIQYPNGEVVAVSTASQLPAKYHRIWVE